jgi:hypothetical protein
MTGSSSAGALALAALLAACSSSSGSTPGPSSNGGTLYGICSGPGAAAEASLGMFVSGVYGFTLPEPAGQTQDVTLTVLNSGSMDATQIVDLTAQTSTLSYEGGTYPGTGGTCGDSLAAGSSCTLVVTLVAPATGRHTSLVVLQYYDGVVYTTDAHQVEVVATTGTFATAKHAPLPQMPQNGGQGPLTKVDFVTVSFSDTPDDSDIGKFGDWLVTSSYWTTIGKDYGVGSGTHQHVRISDSTPDSVIDSQFAAFVDSKVASGELPQGSEAVYAFFLSSATTVTDQAGAGGWHNRSPGGHDYAVILPGCSSDPGDILEQYTFVASHELIESATDPSPLSGYNFGFGEGEVADLCDATVTEDSYAVPTVWSNSAAAKGGDPCLPAQAPPYVSVDPSVSKVSLPSSKGSEVDVTLTGWSTSQVGDWLIQVTVNGQASQAVKATLDPTATDLLNNGETVELEVTTDGSASPGSTAIIEVLSYAPSGDEASIQGVQLIPVNIVSP